jgi:AcrR family transcriptional regulator
MDSILRNIDIQINDKLFLKDPRTSDLGKKIISGSIELIEELGFEKFNFKKLGLKIGSPESSIYRYFENKHKLLLYLLTWYWVWLEYRLVFSTNNIENPKERLGKAIEILTSKVEIDHQFEYVNEQILYKIVISESVKAYLTKEVEKENKEGYFKVFSRIINRVSEMILELNKDFEYSKSLAGIVIDASQQQKFFLQHLPNLCDFKEDNEDITYFFTHLVIETVTKR